MDRDINKSADRHFTHSFCKQALERAFNEFLFFFIQVS